MSIMIVSESEPGWRPLAGYSSFETGVDLRSRADEHALDLRFVGRLSIQLIELDSQPEAKVQVPGWSTETVRPMADDRSRV